MMNNCPPVKKGELKNKKQTFSDKMIRTDLSNITC